MINSTKPSNTRWKILAAIIFCGFTAYVLRTNLSVVGNFMMQDLGITQIQMGWMLSAFIWGYTIFQFPGGILAEIIGPKKTVTLSMIGSTLATILAGLFVFSDISIIYLIGLIMMSRFLIGVSQGPLMPALGGGVVRRWFPKGSWAFPLGLSSTGLAIGASFTPLIITWIIYYTDWQSSFFIISILGILTAWFWHRYSTDWPNEHPKVNQEELNHIGEPPKISPMKWPQVKKVAKDKNVLLLGLSYLCMNYTFYIFFSWIYIYLVNEKGFSLLEGGFFASLPFLAGALGAGLGGLLCDQLQKKYSTSFSHRVPIILGLIPSGIFLILGALTEDPVVAVIYLSLCFGFIEMTEGPYWSSINFVSRKRAQAAGGILNTGGNLGGVISTPLIPILVSKFGWMIALSSGAVFALIGTIFFLMIDYSEVSNEPQI